MERSTLPFHLAESQGAILVLSELKMLDLERNILIAMSNDKAPDD
jgi:hypothetical protein